MKITQKQIKILHTLKHQVAWLCQDRSAWEGFLSSCAGRPVMSSTELSLREGINVIDELAKQVSGDRLQVTVAGRPHNFVAEDRNKQLKYIEHLLAGRSWAYADALARRICKVDKMAFVRGGDLRKIIAALEYDRKRKENPQNAEER